MKKNSQLHVIIETHKLNRLKTEAKEQGVFLAELCRQKLKHRPQMDRIERKLDRLLKKRTKKNGRGMKVSRIKFEEDGLYHSGKRQRFFKVKRTLMFK